MQQRAFEHLNVIDRAKWGVTRASHKTWRISVFARFFSLDLSFPKTPLPPLQTERLQRAIVGSCKSLEGTKAWACTSYTVPYGAVGTEPVTGFSGPLAVYWIKSLLRNNGKRIMLSLLLQGPGCTAMFVKCFDPRVPKPISKECLQGRVLYPCCFSPCVNLLNLVYTPVL